MYFDEVIQQWTSQTQYGRSVCSVKNNLALALDNYVDCGCHHLSLYAVKSDLRNPDMIGYPIWFHISCFICMVSLILQYSVCVWGGGGYFHIWLFNKGSVVVPSCCQHTNLLGLGLLNQVLLRPSHLLLCIFWGFPLYWSVFTFAKLAAWSNCKISLPQNSHHMCGSVPPTSSSLQQNSSSGHCYIVQMYP